MIRSILVFGMLGPMIGFWGSFLAYCLFNLVSLFGYPALGFPFELKLWPFAYAVGLMPAITTSLIYTVWMGALTKEPGKIVRYGLVCLISSATTAFWLSIPRRHSDLLSILQNPVDSTLILASLLAGVTCAKLVSQIWLTKST